MTSRAELIGWVNDLLQLSYTKVEQCGSGGAYAQIIDSIYQDVPMSRIKMNANQEYEYINNFKVLQSIFKKHAIDKPIPVTALVKCKMQDNLEFLQWLKRYWDMHFPGGEYDAAGRRKGAPAEPNPLITTGGGGAAGLRASTNGRPAGGVAPKRAPPAPAVTSGPTRPRVGLAGGPAANQAKVDALTADLAEMRINVEGLEKERDFYFNKLRDIEILVGARSEIEDGSISELEAENLKQIQAILYSTEEGFEAPENAGDLVDEEETF